MSIKKSDYIMKKLLFNSNILFIALALIAVALIAASPTGGPLRSVGVMVAGLALVVRGTVAIRKKIIYTDDDWVPGRHHYGAMAVAQGLVMVVLGLFLIGVSVLQLLQIVPSWEGIVEDYTGLLLIIVGGVIVLGSLPFVIERNLTGQDGGRGNLLLSMPSRLIALVMMIAGMGILFLGLLSFTNPDQFEIIRGIVESKLQAYLPVQG